MTGDPLPRLRQKLDTLTPGFRTATGDQGSPGFATLPRRGARAAAGQESEGGIVARGHGGPWFWRWPKLTVNASPTPVGGASWIVTEGAGCLC